MWCAYSLFVVAVWVLISWVFDFRFWGVVWWVDLLLCFLGLIWAFVILLVTLQLTVVLEA